MEILTTIRVSFEVAGAMQTLLSFLQPDVLVSVGDKHAARAGEIMEDELKGLGLKGEIAGKTRERIMKQLDSSLGMYKAIPSGRKQSVLAKRIAVKLTMCRMFMLEKGGTKQARLYLRKAMTDFEELMKITGVTKGIRKGRMETGLAPDNLGELVTDLSGIDKGLARYSKKLDAGYDGPKIPAFDAHYGEQGLSRYPYYTVTFYK